MSILYADIINMKKIILSFFVLTALIFPLFLAAQTAENFRQEGIASWYGKEFEGRPTASGEIFDTSLLTAAHPSLPFGTRLVVTNLHNNKSVTVRVNDRGPFVAARIIDLSMAAAEQLDMLTTGTAPVLIESIGTVVSAPVAPVETNIQAAPAAFISQSVDIQPPFQIRLTPQINIAPDKTYRLQVGSYRVARNAVDAFEKLKNSGLSPAYERYIDGASSEYFRVVLAGIRGVDVQSITERLSGAGFREAFIREEN